MDELFDILDSAAKQYPIKKLAMELGKAESSLRNELTQQNGYKLGMITAINIMLKTGELKPLKMIGAMFGLIFYQKPKSILANPVSLIKHISSLSGEFGKTVRALGTAMEDGEVTEDERKRCLEKTDELIKACLKLEAALNNGL